MQTIHNGSTSDRHPLWTITGPGFYPKFVNGTSGETWALNYEILHNETVVIDTLATRRTVTSSRLGDVSSYVVSGSTYWALEPGDNDVTVQMGRTSPDTEIVMERRAT